MFNCGMSSSISADVIADYKVLNFAPWYGELMQDMPFEATALQSYEARNWKIIIMCCTASQTEVEKLSPTESHHLLLTFF